MQLHRKYLQVMDAQIETFITGIPNKINTERVWLALSVAAVCSAYAVEYTPFKIFLIIGGSLNGLLILGEYGYAVFYRHKLAQAHLDAFKVANGLKSVVTAPPVEKPITAPPAEGAGLQNEPVLAKVADGNTMLLAENRPSVEFIKWLYSRGYREPGRVVRGEDWIEQNTDYKQAGEWLRLLAEHGWIRGRDGETKKPGSLVGDALKCIAELYPELATVSLRQP